MIVELTRIFFENVYAYSMIHWPQRKISSISTTGSCTNVVSNRSDLFFIPVCFLPFHQKLDATFETEFIPKYGMPKPDTCLLADNLWGPVQDHCRKISLAWAVGGDLEVVLPIEYGYPVGPNSFKYFFIQMHYENPGLDKSKLYITLLNKKWWNFYCFFFHYFRCSWQVGIQIVCDGRIQANWVRYSDYWFNIGRFSPYHTTKDEELEDRQHLPKSIHWGKTNCENFIIQRIQIYFFSLIKIFWSFSVLVLFWFVF